MLSTELTKLWELKGIQSVDSFHKRLGKIMWNKVGLARNEKGLQEAIAEIQKIRKEFGQI